MISPRPLIRETFFKSARQITVAPPCSKAGQDAAGKIAGAIKKYNENVRVEADPEPGLMRETAGPLILIGNLADSRCVRRLYFRFLCVTDCWYPGPGGYELRTLCNPFGTGFNIIHIGYSNPEGLINAVEVFLDLLTDPLPGLMNIEAHQLPMQPDEVRKITAEPLPDKAWQVANGALGSQKGYIYYLTGNSGAGSDYRKAWKDKISCEIRKTDKIVQLHLTMLPWILTWRLAEHSGLFSEDERRAIIRFIYDWVESDEGAPHVDRYFQSKHLPRQNHGIIPALALAYVLDYFNTYFPDVKARSYWHEVVVKAFSPYGRSWKPLCDGLCHGWFMSQPVLLDYGLLDPEHRYFEQDGARKAAECAVAVVNNSGWMPSAGDSSMTRQFPGPSLRMAAAYYGDGRFSFVNDMAPEYLRHRWMQALPPHRAFDCGTVPCEPRNHIGVTVIPVDHLIYNVWADDPQNAALAVDTPPDAPIDECFDKLAVRCGWNTYDDYLLIDGLGGGSHSYADAGGILDYSRFGLSWIVSEDCLVFTAPEDHSAVTIVRDGIIGAPPGFAVLEEHRTDSSGNVYLRIRLKNYAGADWIREIFLRRKRCVVFHDTVIANKPGEYSVEAHFRIPDKVQLKGRLLTGKRLSSTFGDVEFRLAGLSDLSMLRVEEVPIHLRYPEKISTDGRAQDMNISEETTAWKARYQTPYVALNAFSARIAKQMKMGESVSVTHLAQIRGPGEPVLRIEPSEEGILLSDEKSHWVLENRLPVAPPISVKSVAGVNASREILKPRHVFTAPCRVTTLNILQDKTLLIGCDDGRLTALDSAFNTMWNFKIDGPIRDIGVAGGKKPLIVTGHGEAGLTAFSGGGHKLWQHTIVREPCPWPWWELPSPSPVRIAGGVFNNTPLFAVGCGDIQVRLFDAGGRELWKWRYNEGVPGRIEIYDIDNDGVPEIIVGGEILTDVSSCRVLTHDRCLKAEFKVEGWTSRLTSLAPGAIDGKMLLACGASRGRNLHLYDVTGLDLKVDPALCDRRQHEPIIKNARKRHLWEHRLGGAVNGLHICPEEGSIIAGTSQGFLMFFNVQGKCFYHRLLEEGIASIAPLENRLLIRHLSGRLRLLTTAGSDIACTPDSVSSGVVIVKGREIFFTGGKKVFHLIL